MENFARKARYARHKLFYAVVYQVFFLSLLMGCKSKPPILVGFSGELTNSRSGGGVFCRNGIELAVEELNRNNGIHGRLIQLVTKDDQNRPEIARQVDAELAAQGVVAIIGHVTSAQTAATFAQNNQARMVVVNPVSASAEFSQQQDYFFRVVPGNDLLSRALARYIIQQRHIRTITGIYDIGNRTFSETFWKLFQQEFERLGGSARKELIFVAGRTDFQQFATQIQTTAPDALLVMASPVDTAFLLQYLAKQGVRVPTFSSTWAQTEQLIEKGGNAVEGLEMVSVYHPSNPYPAFQPFIKRFMERFKREPTFHAAYGYEAMLVLAEALKHTQGQTSGLPDALSSIRNFPGVQGLISMNAYGDVSRDVYIVRVSNGQFEIVATIPPEN
ncbi:extracellular ligand-binding receptor [Candidatus Moduliflexus flocculans]|uniref:Extracellular ligand-binding receptor n=1 Tax=Candidatus Moduliflexus flocculans TaxID=1499966 RepID=A0A081BP78_9BACT|nr:extracellular ligand-binding receptor [Candidatus Moduliflexus flocculans]